MSDDKPVIGEHLPAGQAEARAESWKAAGRDVRVVDGRKMKLMIAVYENDNGHTELVAEAPGCSRRNAAAILRYAADQFDAAADADGEPPATFDPETADRVNGKPQ